VRLATLRSGSGTVAARVEGNHAIHLAFASVDALLRDPHWPERGLAEGTGSTPLAEADFAPVVVAPSRIVCVGLNYRSHIVEMGRELPRHPTLFAKFRSALIGASDDIRLPPESDEVDWEAELALIIGRAVRRASVEQASQAIAGYTTANDISMRDWQWRTTEWLQGKTFDASTPVGPWLVTTDALDPALDLAIGSSVNSLTMQAARTGDLLFGPAELVSYISLFTTL